MDDVDIAFTRTDEDIQRRVNAIRNAQKPLLTKGVCNYCLEPLNNESTFCDVHCAQDYEQFILKKMIQTF